MPSRHYLLDFDGTVVLEDSLDLLFAKFADTKWREYDLAWERGEIGSLRNLAFAFSTFDLSAEKMDEVVDCLTIDSGFFPFLEWVEQAGGGCTIVSEGLDYIITQVLEKRSPESLKESGFLRSVEVYANRYSGLSVEFPLKQDSCPKVDSCKGCAVCKFRVASSIAGGEKIYVGNGLSDRFGISTCDLIYAKDKLYDFCTSQGSLNCRPFRSFLDILGQEVLRI